MHEEAGHGHSPEAEGSHHHHDHVNVLEEFHPLWTMDRIELKSVGIDVGSSTSHLMFSVLEMRRQSAALSSRFELSKRTILYESDILLTPFTDGTFIDADALSAFFRDAYTNAGLDPGDIDTGAVITTGDAARKDNAAAIVELFSTEMGKFVCASAGPLLEAKMAAYGSGAVARSVETSGTFLNIDVGGGTSKLAIVREGRILDVAATDIGARLITFDSDSLVLKVERAAEIVAKHAGVLLQVGVPLAEADRGRVAERLAAMLLATAARGELPALAKELLTSAPLSHPAEIDGVIFSGGVAEYLKEPRLPSFGDLGPLLAQNLRGLAGIYLPNIAWEAAAQRIRATVIGASQFTAQVSGNTIHIGNPGLLPVRNMRVVTVYLNAPDVDAGELSADIGTALARNEIVDGTQPFAIVLRGSITPSYAQLRAISDGVASALWATVAERQPIFLMIDSDIARLIGRTLSDVLGGYNDIICIDGVELQDFDYIDISEERAESRVVTVVIKSLVFTG